MKPNIRAISCAAAMMSLGSAVQAGEWTAVRSISAIYVSGDSYYATTTNGAPWGAPGCPSATNLYIQRSDPASSQLLALLLAVKAAGGTITAFGDCNVAGPVFFHTNYIIGY